MLLTIASIFFAIKISTGMIVGIGLIAGGALFSYISYRIIKSTKDMIKNCSSACTGKVIDYYNDTDHEGHRIYIPVVQYVVDGTEYTIEGSQGHLEENLPPIGEIFQILYNPQNPNQAYTATNFTGEKITSTIFIIAGIILFLVGFFILFFSL